MQVFEFVCIFSHFYFFILLKQSFCSLPEPSYSLASLVIYAFLSRSYLKRKGIVINETEVVLYGQLLTGRKYVPKANGVVELEKQWAKQVLPFAYQAVVKVPAHKHDSEKKTENNGWKTLIAVYMSLRLWCFSAGSSCCRKIEENLLKLRSAAILMKLNPEINPTHAFSFFLFIVRVVLGKFRFTAHGFDFITFFFFKCL